MSAAHRRSEPPAVAPPAALGRARTRRDAWRVRSARRDGVVFDDPSSVVIGAGIRFDLAAGACLILGTGVVLDDGCRFHLGPDAEVTIGDGTRLGSRCAVTARGRIAVGAGCLLADEVVLIDAGPVFADSERPIREQGLTTSPISVGDGARLGPSVALLAGATVPEGGHIGAHAVVPAPCGTAIGKNPF
jgi:acetyltransferase-like isoleucine patch superfamily enzyme